MLTVNAVEVQKHRLKGPVGYTVVGSPTIVDGVVSGFSSSNYIRTSRMFSTKNIVSSYEIGIKITTGGNVAYRGVCGGSYNWGVFGFRFGDYGYFEFVLNNAAEARIKSLHSLTANTTYDIKASYTVATKKAKISISSDNWQTWETNTKTFAQDFVLPSFEGYINFGYTQDGVFNGSIDLNETYIKVDGKLWFYQTADTKYIVKDGKLVWADPRIYLEGTGTQGIITDIYPNSNYTLEAKIYTTPLSANGVNNMIIDSGGAGRLGFMYRSENNNQNVIWYTFYPTTASSWHLFNYNQAYVLKTVKDASNTYFYINGVLDLTLPIEAFESSSAPLQMWRKDLDSSAYPVGRIYYTKVWNDEGKLVGHFVPVPTGLQIGNFTVPSNGMFDIVNQQFYANQGTGVFAIGRDE